MEAAQTLQASSCLWKAPAKLAKTAFMLSLQLQTTLLSGLSACIQACKLHPFLLFCGHPGVLTTNISLVKRDAFRCSVHMVSLGLSLKAWCEAREKCWKTCKDDFPLNVFRNGYSVIRRKGYPVSGLFCISVWNCGGIICYYSQLNVMPGEVNLKIPALLHFGCRIFVHTYAEQKCLIKAEPPGWF